MSARVIVTQQSKTVQAPQGFRHSGYSVRQTGIQITADPGYEISAIYIVNDPNDVGSSPIGESNWIDTER